MVYYVEFVHNKEGYVVQSVFFNTVDEASLWLSSNIRFIDYSISVFIMRYDKNTHKAEVEKEVL